MDQLMEKARAGDVEAMAEVGWHYYHGRAGVERDYREALEWYGKAAANGHGEALYLLGHMHEDGEGTPVNLANALSYYKQAKDVGYSVSGYEDHAIARVEDAIAANTTAPLRKRFSFSLFGASTDAAQLELEQEELRDQQNDSVDMNTEAYAQRREAALQQKHAAQQQKDRAQQQKEAEQQQKDRVQQQKDVVQQRTDAKLQQVEAEQTQVLAELRQKETELKQLHQTLEAERVRQQQKDAAQQQKDATHQQIDAQLKREWKLLEAERMRLLQLDETVKQERDALDTIKRTQEALQRAMNQAVAAFTQEKKEAAAAKQAEILEERHGEGSVYVPTRDVVAAAWGPTKVKLSDCPVHTQPISAGQSVLLEKCLHAICRDCAPHMIVADRSVSCPLCKVDSPVKRDALAPHPFIEAELAVGKAHDCVMCQNDPVEERLEAISRCTTCNPHKLLCEPHTSLHRARQPNHVITILLHAGAAMRCATHDKLIEAYCSGCHQLICLVCTLTTHPTATHTARVLTDAAFVEGVRARLVEMVAVARTVAEALINHATDATLAVTELDARDAAIGSEIDRAINVLSGLLERRREAAHDQRLARSRNERAALQRTREESEHHWRIITSAADLAEQLATGTHLGVNATAVMVQLEQAATARLSAVLELAPERGVPPPAILRFHFDESLAEQLSTLGEVVQDAP